MANNLWTAEEIQCLRDVWDEPITVEEKAKIVGRTAQAMLCKAGHLNLPTHMIKTDHNIDILLEETIESMYWLGFCFADGHFGKERLSLTLAIKDEKHLMKFHKFISSTRRLAYDKQKNMYRYMPIGRNLSMLSKLNGILALEKHIIHRR